MLHAAVLAMAMGFFSPGKNPGFAARTPFVVVTIDRVALRGSRSPARH